MKSDFKYARYHIPNVVKTLKVLDVMSKNPDGTSRAGIMSATGFTESIVFRILYTLLDYGMILKNADANTYSISKKFISMAYDSISDENLILNSRETMREIRDKLLETVMLGILSEDCVIMIDQCAGKNFFSFSGKAGLKCPLHTSAPAKAILAFLPADERLRIVDSVEFKKFTDRTIVSKKKFLEELDATAERGFSVDAEEYLRGANCVGVPVFDFQGFPVASIWATGPSERMPARSFPEIGRYMRSMADALSRRLGYQADGGRR